MDETTTSQQTHSQGHELPSVVFFVNVRATFDIQKDEDLHTTMVLFEAGRFEGRLECLERSAEHSRPGTIGDL